MSTAAATRVNWAGNYTFQARALHMPRSVAELQELVARAENIRALGARHSFNGIADSAGTQVSLRHLCGMELDEAASAVKVGGGVTYAQLAPYLHQRGYALHNLASLPHITVAGAVQTGTHGSGLGVGSLATAVVGMDLVTATGDLVELTRATQGEQFDGMVVALGALGVVASLTLRIEPTYLIEQTVYESLPLAEMEAHLRAIFSAGRSVSFFTDWNRRTIPQIWVKSRSADRSKSREPLSLLQELGARPAARELHPLPGHSAKNCTPQMGLAGPWHERLPHFRADYQPSSGAELQTEYFVPLERGYEAIQAVVALRERIAAPLYVSELRTVAADELWLSPCYRRESLALHFTFKPDWPAVRRILPELEAALAPFQARPHWAKMFTMPPEQVQALYPKLSTFQALRQEIDPEHKFGNNFLNSHLT